ncbi:aminoglycoside phosphotransferase family protein [Flexivirga sp. B27]
MHDAELDLSTDLVGELLREQHPDLLNRPITRVASHGTVNAMFRTGDLVCRLRLEAVDPDAARKAIDAEVDAARVLSAVDVLTPELVARGEATAAYPMPWTVWRWIDGETASHADVGSNVEFAEAVGRFVIQVHDLPTEGRTFDGVGRGGRLADSDDWIDECLHQSSGLIDTASLRARWQEWRRLPQDPSMDLWTHNDLMPGNLLVRGGRLVGVIDVGQAGVGDPAVDLQPAWNLFRGNARRAFRDVLGADDEQWERGRAWAFEQAIGSLWYYRETNPEMSRTAYRTLTALLEHR